MADLLHIAVDQPPGGGSVYPFVAESDASGPLADLYLACRDEAETLQPPFRVAWLQGFGTLGIAGPSPVHAQDLEIMDALGTSVFDTKLADSFRATAWGSRLEVLQWVRDDAVLRVVRRVPGGDCPDFQCYITPTAAVLDSRACQHLAPRVRSIRVEGGSALSGDLRIQDGYNTTWTAGSTSVADGGRRSTRLTLAAAPGSGLGRYDPLCDEEDLLSVRSINHQKPDGRGNIVLDAGGNYRLERPVLAVLAPGEVRVRDHALQLFNDAKPAGTCQDYANCYEAIRNGRDRVAGLMARAQATRDMLSDNITRFNTQRANRAADPLRLLVREFCPGDLLIAVGYSHQDPETCLDDLKLEVGFSTAYTGTEPHPRRGCTFIQGEFDPDLTVQSLATPLPGSLDGAWPDYSYTFAHVQPGYLAALSFRMVFESASDGEPVTITATAKDSLGATLAGPVSRAANLQAEPCD